jgi:nucleoredoxin
LNLLNLVTIPNHRLLCLLSILTICAPAHAAHESILDGTRGQLIARDGKVASSASIQNKKYLLIYFSAGWCPICKRFTPELIQFYEAYHQYGDFEVLFVSSDKSLMEMRRYWLSSGIPGIAMNWDCGKTKVLTHEYGAENGGIPCMVLLDENDRVLASSFAGGKYLGPDAAIKKYISLR